MDLMATVPDLCQTEMLKVTEALAPRRVHHRAGMWRLFQKQASVLFFPLTLLSNNERLKTIIRS